MSIIDLQFDVLRRRFPAAELVPQSNGTYTVTLPDVTLPAGWNAPTTTVAFVVPAGYPQAAPDCFWTSVGLRLANGGTPQNTGTQAVQGVPADWLWFSWHPGTWNPNTDNLETYVNVIRRRLIEVK